MSHPNHISPVYVTFLAVVSVMTVLSAISSILRFVQRKSVGFFWDDWCILGALVFAFGFLVTTTLVATITFAGYHVGEYSMWELNTYMKVWSSLLSRTTFRVLDKSNRGLRTHQIALANNIIYNASITLSKASVLFFYHRIFGVDRTQKLQLRIVSLLLIGYFLSALFGLIFADSPVEAQWNITLPHTSIHNKAFWCSMAVINMCLDLIILAIPQTRVWRLQLSAKRKILLSLVFLLGALSVKLPLPQNLMYSHLLIQTQCDHRQHRPHRLYAHCRC